jgi:hypothetical protein
VIITPTAISSVGAGRALVSTAASRGDTDRLDQLLSDLSRIDRSLARIAETMSQFVRLMSGQTPAEEFRVFEANLTVALQLIIERQKELAEKIETAGSRHLVSREGV